MRCGEDAGANRFCSRRCAQNARQERIYHQRLRARVARAIPAEAPDYAPADIERFMEQTGWTLNKVSLQTGIHYYSLHRFLRKGGGPLSPQNRRRLAAVIQKESPCPPDM